MKKIIVFVLTLSIVIGSVSAVYAQEESSSSSAAEEIAVTSETATSDAAEENAASAEENAASVEENAASADLTGNWVQKNAEESEIVQTASIQDGIIELYWVHRDGTGSNLYWAGDFTASEENDGTYSSKNNKSKTGYALMASKEEEKTFSLKNNELSYTVSLLGQDIPVVLVKEEVQEAAQAPSESGAAENVSGKPVEFVSGNYSWYKKDGESQCYLYYSVEIRNPNEDLAIQDPNVQVTARAADGSIITTRQELLPSIAAGDTYTFGAILTYEGNAPEKVEMIVGNSNTAYLPQGESGVIPQNMLAVSNVSEIKNDHFIKYTGEITNNSTINLENVCVIVIFKNGNESIGGINTTIDSLASGASRPFEIDMFRDIIEYDSYEVYALPWYPVN